MKNITPEKRYGHLASGASQSWDITIEESLTQEDDWVAVFEGPSAYLTFQLHDLSVIEKAIEILTIVPSPAPVETHSFSVPPLELGTIGESSVSLIKDNENFLRYVILVRTDQGLCVRLTLLEDDVNMLRMALEEVKTEL